MSEEEYYAGGDMKEEIEVTLPKDFTTENRPLTEQERKIVSLRIEKEDLEFKLKQVTQELNDIIQGN